MTAWSLEKCSKCNISIFKMSSLFLFVLLKMQHSLFAAELHLNLYHWIPDFYFGGDPMQIPPLMQYMQRSGGPKYGPTATGLCFSGAWQSLLLLFISKIFLFNDVCYDAVAGNAI